MDKKILVMIAVNIFLFVNAQKENLSSFNVISLNYQFSPKFFLYSELQSRGFEDYTYPDYYEIKGGIGYNLSKNNKPLLGIGRYVNYTNKKLSKEELRFWIQDIVNFNAGIFKFENRFRAEQSYFYEPLKDLNSKRNRFRYRLNISAPLNAKKIEKGTLSANFYDEVFLITPLKPAFARNRVFAGFAYQYSKEVSLATGYLWQREFQTLSNRNFYFLFFAVNINIDQAKQEVENFHSTVPD
ncbi:DUF2490 domain-containing protein [Halpernia sp. GG3]